MSDDHKPSNDAEPRENEPDFVDPLHPFTPVDTALSAVTWPVAISQMVGWLGVFSLVDRFVMPGNRIDSLARLVCRVGTRSVGIRVRRHGMHHLVPGYNYLVALNHVSLLDTPVLVQAVPFFARTFQDAAHFDIPLYGRFVKLMGQVPVRQGDKDHNATSYAEALHMLRNGDNFAVFPEGHRTRDGRLGRFYPGGFRLAIEAGVPVLPCVSRGLRNLCPAGEWRMRPGTVDVIFGQPIPTDGLTLDDAQALADTTRRAMNRLLIDGPTS